MDILYAITIFPIEILYKAIYLGLYSLCNNYGLSLFLFSLVTFFIMKPFEKLVSKIQKKEETIQSVLSPQLNTIKTESKGEERNKRINNLYKRYSYHPILSLRSSVGLLVQVPFLMAAYYMLSNLPQIQGQAFLFIDDLSKPDALLGTINLLPIIMTIINCISVYFYPSSNGQKGKIQLYAIALLFLILLYTAPSALILYWTCNNFLSLLKNLLGKRQYIKIPKVNSTITNKISKLSLPILLAILPFFIMFIAGGINLYINNINEADFDFTISQLIPILFNKTLFYAAIVFFVLILLPKKFSIFKRALAFIFGCSIALLIEGNILASNYDFLDGTTKLSFFELNSVISAFVWITCIILTQKIYKKVNVSKTVLVILLVALPLFNNVYKNYDLINEKQISNRTDFVVDQNFFNFSKEKNTIMIVLDSMNGSVAEEILFEQEYNEIFEGFYWFKDISASGVTTQGGTPPIYGASLYDNSVPFKEYLKNEQSNQIHSIYKNNGYKLKAYKPSGYIADSNLFSNIKEVSMDSVTIKHNISRLLNFSFLPHCIKIFLPTYSDSWDFKMLDNYNKYNFLSQEKQPILLTYHLSAGHSPAIVDENFNISKNATQKTQMQASLKMLEVFLNKLKKANVFDNSTIVITSDHTSLTDSNTNQYIFTAIKPYSKEGPVEEIQSPLSNSQIKNILLDQESGILLTSEYFSKIENNEREFLSYTWTGDFNKEYLPKLSKIKIVGPANNQESYIKNNIYLTSSSIPTLENNKTYVFPQDFEENKNIFGLGWKIVDSNLVTTQNITAYNALDFKVENVIKGLSVTLDFLVENQLKSIEYNLADPFNFTELYPPHYNLKKIEIKETPYTINYKTGFYNAEDWGRWSNANKAQILIVPEQTTKCIKFSIGPVFENQDVTIKANGIEVYSNKRIKPNSDIIINFSQEILADIETGETIIFDFDIPNAVSPKSLGQSEDTRELGIGIKEIVLLDEKKEIDNYQPNIDDLFIETIEYPFYKSGFGNPEGWGCWTDGGKASIVLKPGIDAKGVIFKLLHVFGKQDITIKANGIEVYSESGIQPNSNIEIFFPQEILAAIKAAETITFDFDIPNAVSPESLGQGEDTRELGIGIKEIVLF